MAVHRSHSPALYGLPSPDRARTTIAEWRTKHTKPFLRTFREICPRKRAAATQAREGLLFRDFSLGGYESVVSRLHAEIGQGVGIDYRHVGIVSDGLLIPAREMDSNRQNP